jgi:hypothetical protein
MTKPEQKSDETGTKYVVKREKRISSERSRRGLISSQVSTPTATLLEHTLLTQGFMEVQKAASPCCLQPQNRDSTWTNLAEALK